MCCFLIGTLIKDIHSHRCRNKGEEAEKMGKETEEQCFNWASVNRTVLCKDHHSVNTTDSKWIYVVFFPPLSMT